MAAASMCAAEVADPWRPPNHLLVQQTYEDAAWDRQRFFRFMAERTGWTSRPYGRSPHTVLHNGANLSVCSWGDSITRELHFQLTGLQGHNSFHRLQQWTYAPDDLKTWCSDRRSQCSPSHCSAYLVGGLTLHWLTRSNPQLAFQPDPVEAHARYFAQVLNSVASFAQTHSRPVLLVGSGALDEDTLLSRPSKSDFADFYPLSLLRPWRAVELRIFRNFSQPVQQKSRVYYFDVGQVWERYRGVRCDGMHFGSEFANFTAYGEELQIRRDARRRPPPAGCSPSAPTAPPSARPLAVDEEGDTASSLPEAGGVGQTRDPVTSSPRVRADCYKSSGVYDYYLLRALEVAGLLECVGRWAWRPVT